MQPPAPTRVLTSRAVQSVLVLDENDERPVFQVEEPFRVAIREHDARAHLLLASARPAAHWPRQLVTAAVVAVDRDEGENAHVMCALLLPHSTVHCTHNLCL